MCERAVKLQSYINEWLEAEISLRATTGSSHANDGRVEADFKDLKKLRLSTTEWKHLESVTEMLKRFKNATNHLSESKKPLIRHIWRMYNALFDFLDQMTQELGSDGVDDSEGHDWPQVVRDAAGKGRAKLSKYYAKTDQQRGFLFNCATILDPTQKLTAYEVRYHSYLSQLYTDSASRTTPGLQRINTITAANSSSTWIDMTANYPASQLLYAIGVLKTMNGSASHLHSPPNQVVILHLAAIRLC